MSIGSKGRKRGRPPGTGKPAVFTASFRFVLTPEQKTWVENHGGGAYLRGLLDEDRKRREEAANDDDGSEGDTAATGAASGKSDASETGGD